MLYDTKVRVLGEPKKRKSRKKVRGGALKFLQQVENDRKKFESEIANHFDKKMPKSIFSTIRKKSRLLSIQKLEPDDIYAEEIYNAFMNVHTGKNNTTESLSKNIRKKHSATIDDMLLNAPYNKNENLFTIKTTYFALEVEGYRSYSNTELYLDLKFSLSFPTRELAFMMPYVTEANERSLMRRLLLTYLTQGTIDTLLDSSYTVSGSFANYGLIKLFDGRLFYLQKDVQAYDAREELFSTDNMRPSNQLILVDPSTETFVQTNSNGEVVSLSLKGASRPMSEDIKSWLEKTFDQAIANPTYPNSLFSIWQPIKGSVEELFTGDLEFDYKKWHNARLHAIHAAGELVPIVRKLKKIYTEKRTNVLPTTYYFAVAVIQLILEYISKYEAIRDEVINKREGFNKATKKDIPAVSNLNKSVVFFSHQAEGFAKLDKAQELAVIDVSPGGGKSLLTILDIQNLMMQGKIKRPLVVVPKSLVANWIGEINFFTDCTFNAFAITTDTLKGWDSKDAEDPREAFGEKLAAAPLNTIFITTYSTIANGSIELPGKVFEYPNIEFIRKYVRPDYVALDESHLIKNPDSKRTKALLEMKFCPYRRIMTGTLMPNSPLDLIGQVGFLNPNVVGADIDEFVSKYAEKVDEKGKALEWKPNFAELIREDLRNNIFYLHYTEKDWAAALPEMKIKYHIVEMTDAQKAVYSVLVREALDEIANDPNLTKAWNQLVSGAVIQADDNKTEGESDEQPEDDIFEDLSVQTVFTKLMKLEQFLSSPDLAGFIARASDISEKDKISPKLEVIDSLIEKSIKAGHKALVAVHYKSSAHHLMERSKFRNQAIYYDAKYPKAIRKFKDDPNIKVMFAVCQSITEGHNLQVCDRIIIADKDWTPGKEKQLMARIYRPHVGIDKKTGKRVNLNEGKTVYMDYVLADNSADLIKTGYQVYKKLLNAKIADESPIPVKGLPRLMLSEDTLKASAVELGIPEYLQREYLHSEWFREVVEEYKKTKDFSLVEPKIEKVLPTKTIKTPWVVGMPLPKGLGGQPVIEYLEDNNIVLDEETTLKTDSVRKLLIDKPVLTETGYGKIVSIRSEKMLGIINESGERENREYDKVLILEKPTVDIEMVKETVKDNTDEIKEVFVEDKKDKQKKIKVEEFDADDDLPPVKPTERKPKSETKPKVEPKPKPKPAPVVEEEDYELDNEIELAMVLYNDIPTLRADLADPDSANLKKIGFVYQGPYYFLKLRSKRQGKEVLEALNNKYSITQARLNQCYEIIEWMNKSKYEYQVPDDFKTFHKVNHRVAPKGTLKIYPFVDGMDVYLVIDTASHPWLKMAALSKYMFKKNDNGYWYFFGGKSALIKQAIAKVKSLGLTITNKRELLKQAETFKIKLGKI